jgi:hypothetical protein
MEGISGDNSRVALQVCTCGRFHVTYGKITQRFEPHEFVKFAGDVSSLCARVKQFGNEDHIPMGTSRDHTLCH